MAGNDDSCTILQATHTIYSVPEAAALWCRIQKDRVQAELNRATPVGNSTAMGRATLRHPSIPCLEVRIRAMHQAIDNGTLDSCREDGQKSDGHIAYERRHVYGQDLKEWAKHLVPNERPAFLFDDLERQAHGTVTVEAFQALQAERDALRAQRDKNAQDRDEKDRIIQALEQMISKKQSDNDETEVRRLQRALGALALGMAKQSDKWRNGDNPNVSAFVNAALSGAQDEHGNAPYGYGESTLSDTIGKALKACQNELDR